MDEQFVREWVEIAARGVGMGGATDFTDRVIARIRKGAREYGDENYLTVSLEELEREGAEEADDIAGWMAAATARIFAEIRHGSIEPERAAIKQELYLRAAGLGLLAWREIEAAREA